MYAGADAVRARKSGTVQFACRKIMCTLLYARSRDGDMCVAALSENGASLLARSLLDL
ncbi:hypothetical protein K469DRAFT_699314 [Zopfia rhizophila CBS 207.26]|uniref:Uncharacterized protein n=1 Tax=Zopfia rhizophila CBS 207.26 TaxID=1314779 RepID=A0A6A6EU99_9PEZI|nr:hypothetical protein K469DRAFT_699314 [Zopfia rhizophila CBS 207.26]